MKYKVTLNGKTYEVEVERGEAIITSEYVTLQAEAQPLTVEKPESSAPLAPQKVTPTSSDAVTAPIPGTVIKVYGTEGKSVKRGEPILVIEAMKMENEILAPEDGTLTTIYVSKGTNVQSGDALFVIA